jgi:hypothetical protein
VSLSVVVVRVCGLVCTSQLEHVVEKIFDSDPHHNRGLKYADRSFFYNEVCVGWARHATSVAAIATPAASGPLEGWFAAAQLEALRAVTDPKVVPVASQTRYVAWCMQVQV